MQLTNRQKSVLIGTVLGDGCLEFNGTKARLRIDHSEKQKQYVEWKHEIFTSIAASKPRLTEFLDKRTAKIYQHRRFDTLTSDIFADYMRIFYKKGKKKIPSNIDASLKIHWHWQCGLWTMDINAEIVEDCILIHKLIAWRNRKDCRIV